jgi:hypothetical protein
MLCLFGCWVFYDLTMAVMRAFPTLSWPTGKNDSSFHIVGGWFAEVAFGSVAFWGALRLWRSSQIPPLITEPDAAPNAGPATPTSNSGVTDRTPSVN